MGTADVLQGFFKSGAVAALVADNVGKIVSEVYSEGVRFDGLAETLPGIIPAATQLYQQLNKGELERQQVLFGDYQLHVVGLDKGFYLVLVLGARANLGRVRLDIRKNRAVLEADL